MTGVHELVRVECREVGAESMQTVNARGLHAFLEVRSDFRNWIKNRINDFGFIENQDFVTAGKFLPSGKTQIDYHISLDMAKELSMIERNAKGKQARQYFIECEKRLRNSLEWERAREEGKLSRKAETDVIEEFVEYATAQGSQNAKHYYINLTKGTYKALYLLDKSADVKNLRERLSVMQLNQLSTAESVARKAIAEYMDIGTHYKDIYRIAIDRVITLADLLGKQLPGNDNVRGINHKEAA